MTDTHTTAHIPDEAVQAANLAYCRTMDATDDFNASIRSAIIAALPHLSAPCAVTKPVDVAAVPSHVKDTLKASLAFVEGFDGDEMQEGILELIEKLKNALSAEPAQHPDDAAVDNFARMMKAKLAQKRKEGRGGWQDMSADDLTAILRQHVDKGDPVDVANLCMMLSENGQRIAPAEPAQGKQWQSIELVGDNERLIIIGSYNAKGSWCAEVWHTKYLRDQQAKSADGFFMNAPHLEWVPTHFMELPAAPTTEAGK